MRDRSLTLAITAAAVNAAAFGAALESIRITDPDGSGRRGRWPLRLKSRSKYRPMNETASSKAAARRRKQMGIDDSCDYVVAN